MASSVLAEQSTQPLLVRQPSLESKRLQPLTLPLEPVLSTSSKTLVSSSHTSENFPSLITEGTPINLFSTQTDPLQQERRLFPHLILPMSVFPL